MNTLVSRSLHIELDNIGKRFNREWVFAGITLTVEPSSCVAITGGNGSGKSTLLQVLAGYLTPSAGRITWMHGRRQIPVHKVFAAISWATPNVALYDEFTLRENIEFFLKFKQLQSGMGIQAFADRISLSAQINKPLKNYSSGMRQRVKLGLAILADTPLLLLDEPASHLDTGNTHWYQQLLSDHRKDRTILIASNHSEVETTLCNRQIHISDYWKT